MPPPCRSPRADDQLADPGYDPPIVSSVFSTQDRRQSVDPPRLSLNAHLVLHQSVSPPAIDRRTQQFATAHTRNRTLNDTRSSRCQLNKRVGAYLLVAGRAQIYICRPTSMYHTSKCGTATLVDDRTPTDTPSSIHNNRERYINTDDIVAPLPDDVLSRDDAAR